MSLFANNLQHFQQCFHEKLNEMLSPDELGAFVLVLANSMQDEHLYNDLKPKLESVFLELDKRLSEGTLTGSPDDMTVFSALAKTGIRGFGPWKTKPLGDWSCAYNPLRALRPNRAANDVFDNLHRPFSEKGFHFDKPFLKPEILQEECIHNMNVRVFYHKFPFAPYHLLILLEPEKHQAQFLTESANAFAWELLSDSKISLPGFGLSYNSLGASASINHLHLHGFIQPTPFAIEQPHWQHNGGNDSYPVTCERFSNPERCWQKISQLHNNNQPYNLLYRPGTSYLISRQAQGLQTLPTWLPYAGWFELCGGFNLVMREDFDSLTGESIKETLRLLKI